MGRGRGVRQARAGGRSRDAKRSIDEIGAALGRDARLWVERVLSSLPGREARVAWARWLAVPSPSRSQVAREVGVPVSAVRRIEAHARHRLRVCRELERFGVPWRPDGAGDLLVGPQVLTERFFSSRGRRAQPWLGPGPEPAWLRRARPELGVKPDRQLARRYGVTPATVARARYRLGVPPAGTATQKQRVIAQVPRVRRALGRVPDLVIAEQTGFPVLPIKRTRFELGIPRAPTSTWRPSRTLTPAIVDGGPLLGVLPDAVVASLLGVSTRTVVRARQRDGIPAGGPAGEGAAQLPDVNMDTFRTIVQTRGRRWVARRLDALSPRQAEVVRRLWLDRAPPRAADLAARMGIRRTVLYKIDARARARIAGPLVAGHAGAKVATHEQRIDEDDERRHRDAFDVLVRRAGRGTVRRTAARLDRQERDVLRRRFLSGRPEPIARCARRHELTARGVQRLERRALVRLAEQLAGEGS